MSAGVKGILVRALFGGVSPCWWDARWEKHILLHQQGAEAVKVKDKVLAGRVDVVDDGVHAAHLRRLLHHRHLVRERLGLRPELQLTKCCAVVCRLLEQLLLDELDDHGYGWSDLHHPTLVRPKALTHGDLVLDAPWYDNVGNFPLRVDKLPDVQRRIPDTTEAYLPFQSWALRR
jgi:hypothetical protein